MSKAVRQERVVGWMLCGVMRSEDWFDWSTDEDWVAGAMVLEDEEVEPS